jgi:hypothetical protein
MARARFLVESGEGIWPQKGAKGAKKMGQCDFSFLRPLAPFCGHSSFRIQAALIFRGA